jgi:hemerythrin
LVGQHAHRKQHAAFLTRVEAFRSEAGAGDPAKARAFFDYVADWIVGHIRSEDHELAAFLRTRQAA